MPYLSIQTNQALNDIECRSLMEKSSQLVSELLGKSENYVMVSIPPAVPMLFAGKEAPTAFLELKSIGLPQSLTGELSQALCTLVSSTLNIAQDRIYVEFADAERSMWGWNGKTF